MKKLSLFAALVAVSLSAAAKEERYDIDPTHTYPHFEISHLGFSTMRGVFGETAGVVKYDEVAKTGSVEVTIQTASLDTQMEKRDNHLKSKDFFNVAQFPTMTFKSDKFSFDGDKLAKVEGELTLLGVTKPVTLTATHFACGKNPLVMKLECGAELTGTIKRSDFGMTTYVPAIGDEVTLRIEVEAYKHTESKSGK